jgi:hypothetical protein
MVSGWENFWARATEAACRDWPQVLRLVQVTLVDNWWRGWESGRGEGGLCLIIKFT